MPHPTAELGEHNTDLKERKQNLLPHSLMMPTSTGQILYLSSSPSYDIDNHPVPSIQACRYVTILGHTCPGAHLPVASMSNCHDQHGLPSNSCPLVGASALAPDFASLLSKDY